MRRVATQRASFVALLIVVIWAGRSQAYQTYSVNRDATNCRACHGDFQADNYKSKQDETPWNTSLMNGHSNMVSLSACGTCHQSSFFPVSLDASTGAGGLSAMGCVGCHGREQDAGHDDSVSGGRGAGLRQHHFSAGVTVCTTCHTDANPANYVPVGENIAPANYFTPDTAHPNKPTDPCNANGSESKFGPVGLDNDGNGLYDLDDPACQVCVGNCHGGGTVTVDDIITMVDIALGNVDISTCSAGDANSDHQITLDEILKAVNNALNGC